MIIKLHIENFILIDSLDIDIDSGLNTVTGETGAGKSILLGAISLLLGSRGDSSLIKKSAKSLIIEGEFDVTNVTDNLKPIFINNDIEFSTHLTIRRIITESGKSKNYINEEPVTQSFLKDISSFLIDIHSQHQTLLLSNQSFQRDILDIAAGSKGDVATYKQTYLEISDIKSVIKELKELNEKSKLDRDYIIFQYEQLTEANLKDGEKEELEAELDILSNAATIGEALYKSNNIFNDENENVISSLQLVNNYIGKIACYLPDGEELINRIESVVIELKDVSRDLENIATQIEDNPKRLSEVENRLDILLSLEKKHSVGSTQELIELREVLATKLDKIDNLEDNVVEQERKLQVVEEKGWKQSLLIREKRLACSGKLAKDIVTNLIQLGMPNAHIKIEISPKENLGNDGADDILFLFSANGMTNLEKIDKAASGGEMSRLMLSLKAISSNNPVAPTIIFDEIDTGVSGKVADQMGRIIELLSKNHQIINITHLPQVACKGSSHFNVYKEHKDGNSSSHIIKLTEEQRIKEIASMLSGSNLTDAALSQAKMLLSK